MHMLDHLFDNNRNWAGRIREQDPEFFLNLTQLACDRYEIADALHRYAFGLDHGDADSLASAFTEDCIFDFGPAGKKLEINFAKFNGRQAIVDALIPFIGPLDTSHTVSN